MKTKTRVWIRGLVSGFIGGGFGAISSGFGSMVVAPDKFNLQEGIGKTFQLMGICFLVQAIVTASAYLQKSPLPPDNGDAGFIQKEPPGGPPLGK